MLMSHVGLQLHDYRNEKETNTSSQHGDAFLHRIGRSSSPSSHRRREERHADRDRDRNRYRPRRAEVDSGRSLKRGFTRENGHL